MRCSKSSPLEDDESPDFATRLTERLAALPPGSLSTMIGYRYATGSVRDSGSERQESDEVVESYLRLVFRDELAAYYQFPIFPDFDWIEGSSRKRAGDTQHIRLELRGKDALQWFIEACRDNPHLIRIEHSSAEEFHRAPSHAI